MTDTQPYGQIAKHWLGQEFRLQVLHSATGFYIGTADEDGLPCSRESDCYWPERDPAQSALDTGQWPQKRTP
jgi:hypothetical protein